MYQSSNHGTDFVNYVGFVHELCGNDDDTLLFLLMIVLLILYCFDAVG